MKEFKKSGCTRVQMYEQNAGYYVLRWYMNKKWRIILKTNKREEAEKEFYWLVALCSKQLKYVFEL